MDNKDIGKRIREYRKSHTNLTIAQLGNAIGVSEQAASQYELGKRSLSPQTLAAVATALDCSVDYLLGKTDDPNLTFVNDEVFFREAINSGKIKMEKEKSENNSSQDYVEHTITEEDYIATMKDKKLLEFYKENEKDEVFLKKALELVLSLTDEERKSAMDFMSFMKKKHGELKPVSDNFIKNPPKEGDTDAEENQHNDK